MKWFPYQERAQMYPPILGGKILRPPLARHIDRILKLLHYTGTSNMIYKDATSTLLSLLNYTGFRRCCVSTRAWKVNGNQSLLSKES